MRRTQLLERTLPALLVLIVVFGRSHFDSCDLVAFLGTLIVLEEAHDVLSALTVLLLNV